MRGPPGDCLNLGGRAGGPAPTTNAGTGALGAYNTMTERVVDPLIVEHWRHIQSLLAEVASTASLLPEFRDAPISYSLSRLQPWLESALNTRDSLDNGENPTKRRRIPGYLRQLVYSRDRFKCVKCGSRGPLTLDHIIPWSKGGLTIFENLQTMCKKCNEEKADSLEEESE